MVIPIHQLRDSPEVYRTLQLLVYRYAKNLKSTAFPKQEVQNKSSISNVSICRDLTIFCPIFPTDYYLS